MKSLKIIALIGSPRNEESWTYKSIKMLETRMNEITPTKFEYVFLQKVNLPMCDGCLHCVSIGEHSCPEFAKIGPIAEKLDRSDGVVLGAPVHTFAVTGLMKNFVEYFMYKRNRPSFFGKKAVVTATASGGGHTNVLDFLEGTATAWGCDVISRMGISSSQMHKEKYLKLVEQVVDEIANEFVREIDKAELGSPKFNALMNFRAMQNMTRNQKESVNYRYWQDRQWLDAEFYTDASLNPIARFMAGYISRKMRKSIRKGNAKPFR